MGWQNDCSRTEQNFSFRIYTEEKQLRDFHWLCELPDIRCIFNVLDDVGKR